MKQLKSVFLLFLIIYSNSLAGGRRRAGHLRSNDHSCCVSVCVCAVFLCSPSTQPSIPQAPPMIMGPQPFANLSRLITEYQLSDPSNFITYYKPRFRELGNVDFLVQRYCPAYVKAGPQEQKMMDSSVACSQLKDLAQGSKQHRATMLKDLSRAFPARQDDYAGAISRSLVQHKQNLTEISAAEKKCGCVEPKKAK